MSIAAYPYVGQRVICILAGGLVSGEIPAGYLVEGHRYTIKSVHMNRFDCCGGTPPPGWSPHGLRLHEVKGFDDIPFFVTRFRPLGEDDFSIDVFNQILHDVNVHGPKQTERV